MKFRKGIQRVMTCAMAVLLAAAMTAPVYAATNPFAQMEAQSRQAVEAAIKAGTVPPGTTIYDCMYGTDKNGVTIVIQYKDKNGSWIDVVTQEKKEYLPGTFTEKLSDETLAEYAAEVFRLVNEEREKAGLYLLERDAELDHAAIARANECVSVNSIYVDGKAHTRPNGSSWETVLDDMGIDWTSVGENSSSGRTSASDVMNAWLNSDGHKANILTQKRTQIGIGVRQASDGTLYWIQIFNRP